MKKTFLIAASAVFLFLGIGSVQAQSCGTHAITYTSSYPWVSGHGMIGTKNNDWTRLNWLLTNCTGKIIFDEGEYNINDTLPVYAYRLLEGTGSSGNLTFKSAKILQHENKAIFKIGTGVVDVSIRDMALIGLRPLRDEGGADINQLTYGIHAEGGLSNLCTPADSRNCSSIGFQFSNLRFENLNKGIYVNALNTGVNRGIWQFDNVRLDHSRFAGCITGIHINSFNSGWNMTSLGFHPLAGSAQGDSDSTAGKTYGIYFEKGTYSTMDELIGNGPSSEGPALATALLFIREAGQLSIRAAVSEGFHRDVVIRGVTRNAPITLMTSTFMSGVDVKDATVYSTGNQFTSPFAGASTYHGAPAVAKGYAQIYSMADKYCNEGDYSAVLEDPHCEENRGFALQGDARNVFAVTQWGTKAEVPLNIRKNVFTDSNETVNIFTSAPLLSLVAPTLADGPLMRLGRDEFFYDFTRSEYTEDAGYLQITATQAGYGGISFKTTPSSGASSIKAKINHDGSVTVGTVAFSSLGTVAGSNDDGTMVYCNNCQELDPCQGFGSGAFAKKINGRWDCN